MDVPKVSDRQLEKLGRGEALVKVLGLIQIIYLIVQLIDRYLAHLSSALLEVATLVFFVLSMITYFIYWNQPQGVETVHIMKAKHMPHIGQVRLIAKREPSYLLLDNRPVSKFDKELDHACIPNDAIRDTESAMSLPPKIGEALGRNNRS
jgi:hypothetical protein